MVRNISEEDHPQPHAAKQIEPEVALDRKRERCRILIGHHGLSILSCWVSRQGKRGDVGSLAKGSPKGTGNTASRITSGHHRAAEDCNEWASLICAAGKMHLI